MGEKEARPDLSSDVAGVAAGACLGLSLEDRREKPSPSILLQRVVPVEEEDVFPPGFLEGEDPRPCLRGPLGEGDDLELRMLFLYFPDFLLRPVPGRGHPEEDLMREGKVLEEGAQERLPDVPPVPVGQDED